jgi:hypothetical protein
MITYTLSHTQTLLDVFPFPTLTCIHAGMSCEADQFHAESFSLFTIQGKAMEAIITGEELDSIGLGLTLVL